MVFIVYTPSEPAGTSLLSHCTRGVLWAGNVRGRSREDLVDGGSKGRRGERVGGKQENYRSTYNLTESSSLFM